MKPIHRPKNLPWSSKVIDVSRMFISFMGISAFTLVFLFNQELQVKGFEEIQKVDAQTTALTSTADADAYAKQANPTTNYGMATSLQVNGVSNPEIETFLRFRVSGVSGTIQSARLRLYATTNGTKNGPEIYATSSAWTETGLTWNNRPDHASSAADNKGKIGTNTWVEYDVTSLVAADGTYSFVLVADSSDGVRFSSRQGNHPPELVLTLNDSQETAAPTTEETSTAFPTETSTEMVTGTLAETSAPTDTVSPGETSSPTSTDLPTETGTLMSDTVTPTQIDTGTPTPTNTSTPTSTSPASDGVVLVGAGDISTCTNNNDEATAKLLDAIPGTVFVAGDNAYTDGSLAQYTNCYDPTWGRHKARTKPVPGNHEYQTLNAAGYFQYFNNVPAYYAFNLGSWRIYALNSELSVTATSAQVTWLQDDLATNPSQCVLAIWHKPRWSSGSSHGSNSAMQSLWQVLYSAGAEVVINGHEHNYERFAEMNAAGTATSQGLREFVAGTGGNGHYGFGTILPSSEVRNSTTYGVLKMTLRSGSYDWEFVPVAGATFTDSGSASCH